MLSKSEASSSRFLLPSHSKNVSLTRHVTSRCLAWHRRCNEASGSERHRDAPERCASSPAPTARVAVMTDYGVAFGVQIAKKHTVNLRFSGLIDHYR
jgi:hypothetical protein